MSLLDLLNYAFGAVATLGAIMGVVWWLRRGGGIPRSVHFLALALLCWGLFVVVYIAWHGLLSWPWLVAIPPAFGAFAYLGWLWCGAPLPDEGRN